MSREFKLHSIESAPEGARQQLEKIQRKFGMLPNFFRVAAESPAALKGYLGLMEAMEETAFTPAERNVIILAASYENGCTYCMPVYTAAAKRANVDDAVIEALRSGRSLSDPKLEALRRLTRAMVKNRGHVDDETLDRFFEQGYTHQNYLEVLLGVTFKTFANYMNHAAHPPLDEAFQPFRWEPPQ
jgi:uncharacterized peroxidase-related enzyme